MPQKFETPKLSNENYLGRGGVKMAILCDAATASPSEKSKPFNVGPSFCPKEIKNYARVSGRCFSLGGFFPEFGDPF